MTKAISREGDEIAFDILAVASHPGAPQNYKVLCGMKAVVANVNGIVARVSE